MLDNLSQGILDGLKAVLSFFPDSPFTILKSLVAPEYAELLAFLNWFIPVGTFVGILEAWLAGIAIYYVWQVILRWLKAIE